MMQWRYTFLGCISAVVALQLGWAQVESESAVYQPSPDLARITVPHVPGELVVGLERNDLALPIEAMEMVGTIVSSNPAINAFVVRLAPGISMHSAGEFLRALPGVRYVEPNYLAFALATPNDPNYSQQYGLARIQANLAWDIWQPQRVVHIAIIDTGIDSNHPDLTNKMRRHSNGAVYGYNTLNNTTNALDDNGHGTHCAGIAAAEINNGIGIAGVAAWNPNVANSRTFVQLMPVKVLSASGSGSLDAVARGITWAADNGAHILSMSLGAGSGAQQLQDAVNYAWNRGCLVVAAAGNSGSSAPMYPAFYTNCIAVAATDSSDTLASFSQFGSWVDIAAPGVNVLSTYPNNQYRSLSGTSMACPHVAGAAAVVWSHNPNLTNAQLRSVLETNVDPYQPYAGRTIAPNAGRLNVYRALQAAGGGGPTQPSLSSLSLNPSSVVGGNSSTGTVTLTAPAPTGGFVVNLSSSNTNVATVPSSVTVPAGATSATFTVSTRAVSSTTNVTITASAGGVSRQATLTVNPASSSVTLQSLTISPTSVMGGRSATGTVTLSGPAPAGGVVVQLVSSNPSRASVPSSVTVPAGATSATFTIRTTSVFGNVTGVTITATYNGVSRSAVLTVWF
ncbi:MAG: S8 family serine peptidase [Fimbriimonadales bacterium]|nr:S8 family serine peptidase [Fimbriimonadales bacterium]